MSGEAARWQRLSQLFDRAIDLDAAGRAALIEAECGEDPTLRAELERMLAADEATWAIDDGAAALASLPAAADDDGADDRDAQIGPWRLGALLGRGGMGSVYAAHRVDGDTGQRAAVKRLRRRWDGSAQAQRFLQERRILARLSHPNIPALIDHGLDHDGRPWFALEFVDGDTLVAWADARRLDLRARIALFLQVAAAVQHAHEHFVVHRDLKPSNILVDRDGRVRVLDFGVAKRLDLAEGATGTGLFAGFTPEYAAPEQVTGGAISAATDVYALGVVLYQLLAGQLPYTFSQDDLRDAAEAITHRTADPLDRALTTGDAAEVQARIERRRTTPAAFQRFVRGDLTRIVQTALAKEPERRYPSVQAFAQDLHRFLEGRPVSVSGDTFGYRARKFVQRNRGVATLAGLVVLVTAVGTAAILVQSARTREHAREAERQAEQARQVRDFALQLLRDANPSNGGFGGDLQQVFAHTAPTLARRFSGQPELLAQTADLLASAISDAKDRAPGEHLLREVRAQLAGDPSAPPWTRAMVDVRLAQETLASGEAAETDALLDGAIAALSPSDPEQVPILSDAWQVRAYQRLGQGREQEAMEAARTASRLTHAHLPAGALATLHADLGLLVLLATTGATPPADALAQGRSIFDAIDAHYGSQHPVTQRAMKFLAMLQSGNGLLDEAEATHRRMLADAEADGDDGRRFTVLMELASVLEDGDRFAEAEAAFEDAIAIGSRINAPDRHIMAAVRNNLAFARYRAGDWSGAAAGFAQAADIWRRVHGDASHAYVLSAQTRQADALVEAGQLAQAGRLLDDLLPRLAAHDADFHPLGLAARAKLHVARHDPASAQRDIDAAFAAAAQGDLTPRSQAALWLVRGRVLLAQDERTGAAGAADRAASLLQDRDSWRNPERARVALLQFESDADASLCRALRPRVHAQPATEDLPFQAPLRRATARCPG